jgi:hypothetical protein
MLAMSAAGSALSISNLCFLAIAGKEQNLAEIRPTDCGNVENACVENAQLRIEVLIARFDASLESEHFIPVSRAIHEGKQAPGASFGQPLRVRGRKAIIEEQSNRTALWRPLRWAYGRRSERHVQRRDWRQGPVLQVPVTRFLGEQIERDRHLLSLGLRTVRVGMSGVVFMRRLADLGQRSGMTPER